MNISKKQEELTTEASFGITNEDAVKQAFEENAMLKEQVKALSAIVANRRLDLVMRCIESEVFQGTDFYEDCRLEIMSALKISKEQAENMKKSLE